MLQVYFGGTDENSRNLSFAEDFEDLPGGPKRCRLLR